MCIDHAMEQVLGSPSDGFYFKDLSNEDLFKRLLDYDKANYIVAASSKATAKKSDGIVGIYLKFNYLGTSHFPAPPHIWP